LRLVTRMLGLGLEADRQRSSNISSLIGRRGRGLPAGAAVTIPKFLCGRFTLRSKPEAIAAEFGLPSVPLLGPRHNVAPTQGVAAVRLDSATGKAGLRLEMARCSRRKPGFPPARPARYDAAGGGLCLARSRGMPGC
jgi:hypothetical protein